MIAEHSDSKYKTQDLEHEQILRSKFEVLPIIDRKNKAPTKSLRFLKTVILKHISSKPKT